MKTRIAAFLALGLALVALAIDPADARSAAARLEGSFVQGGLVTGTTDPGAEVTYNGRALRVSPNGRFVFGFGRDAPGQAELRVALPDGRTETIAIAIAPRTYQVQQIDGLPSRMVTPKEADLVRIRADAAKVAEARAVDRPEPMFESGYTWPATGIVTGVYGSQRILNGEPRRPHFGVDIAAPTGTPVNAAADGVVAMADDLYFTGGTVILDHGFGLTTTYSHLQAMWVVEGQKLRRGEPVGTVGATGRATGAHLDWRMNWFDQRLDPALVVPPMPAAPSE